MPTSTVWDATLTVRIRYAYGESVHDGRDVNEVVAPASFLALVSRGVGGVSISRTGHPYTAGALRIGHLAGDGSGRRWIGPNLGSR